MVQHRSHEASQRLETIPGIGVIGATAIAATVPDPKVFGSGRDFAAWIGLVPLVPGDKMVGEIMVANDLVSFFKG
jgi:transposase